MNVNKKKKINWVLIQTYVHCCVFAHRQRVVLINNNNNNNNNNNLFLLLYKLYGHVCSLVISCDTSCKCIQEKWPSPETHGFVCLAVDLRLVLCLTIVYISQT